MTNSGTAPAKNGFVTDPLPDPLKFISATASQGTYTLNQQLLTFNIGVVNPNQTVTLTIVTAIRATTVPPADIRNIASLTATGILPRYATASIHLAGGKLPGTGEYPQPDRNNLIWLTAFIIVGAAIAIVRFRQVRKPK